MIHSYLKIALRMLRKQPVYTAINVVGLAVGVTAFLLLALYIRHELRYDDFHAEAERIVRVVETRSTPEGSERVASTAGPVGPAAARELPGVEEAVRVTRVARVTVERGDTRFYVGDYLLTGPNFFDVFGFPLAQGDRQTALREPGTVILTHDAARRYFGDENPIGKTLVVEAIGETRVTGVLEPLPETSHLQFSMLFPFSTMARQVDRWTPWMSDWAPDVRPMTTYVRLNEGATREVVAEQLLALMARNTDPDAAMPEGVALQPLTDIHLHSAGIQGGFNARPGDPTYVWAFGAIALFILLIACINYMNLATARAADRSREVGLRKALGAQWAQLVGQYVGEAVLLCAIALALGIALGRGVLPAFNHLAGVALTVEGWAHPEALLLLLTGALAVGGLAGAYPAFVIARFRPAEVLKASQGTTQGGAVWLRRTLVVTQFALSIGLIAATLVVARQLDYVQSKRLGFTAEHRVVVDINSNSVRRNMETMKAEMRRHPAVRQVSVSSRVPGDWKGITDIQLTTPGADSDDVRSAYFMGVDGDFLATYDIALAAGRNFEAARGTDTTAVLLNEAAVRALGLADPVGATIRVPQGLEGGGQTEAPLALHVIGVVEDFHFQSLYVPIRPLVLGYHDNPIDGIDYFTARVEAGQMPAAIEHLRAIGEQFDPAHPFEYNILDARIADVYQTDRRVGRIFGAAAGLAILIACFGLFGLAAYTAERRRKEIGIRKVLGATVANIVRLLSTDYLKLVGIAFLVGAPLAYVAMQRWLEDFAYRVELGPAIFLLAGGLALTIALLTVSYQAIKAALTDPATSLRHE